VIWTKASNDRLQGWEQVKKRLVGQDGKPWLVVFDTCTHTVRTLPTMIHSKTKPEDMDTDGEDHAADETRYFCASRPWAPEKAKEPPPDDYGRRRQRQSTTAWSA